MKNEWSSASIYLPSQYKSQQMCEIAAKDESIAIQFLNSVRPKRCVKELLKSDYMCIDIN